MILPNLPERGAYYQDVMRPDDPEMGKGIGDWTITYEYRSDLVVGDTPAWGCMCSPNALPSIEPLTTSDIANKVAHIIIRTPTTPAELAEVDRTLLHELGHVLVAPMQSQNVAAEENAMHSIDALFSKLSPAEGQVLARAIHNPKARAYRAPDGDNMADPKGPEGDKKTPDGEVKKDVGTPRDVAAIQADIINAVMAGQPTDDLVKELVAAQALAGAAAADADVEVVEPLLEVPQMGMTQAQAHARVQAAHKEAIEAIVDANPHLDEKQRVMVRKQGSAAAARELVATYPRPRAEPEVPRMGMGGHPSTAAGGGAALTVRARAMQADPAVMARIRRATSEEDTLGLYLDEPGHVLVFSPAELLKEQLGALKRAQKGAVL